MTNVGEDPANKEGRYYKDGRHSSITYSGLVGGFECKNFLTELTGCVAKPLEVIPSPYFTSFELHNFNVVVPCGIFRRGLESFTAETENAHCLSSVVKDAADKRNTGQYDMCFCAPGSSRSCCAANLNVAPQKVRNLYSEAHICML